MNKETVIKKLTLSKSDTGLESKCSSLESCADKRVVKMASVITASLERYA
jgi:hypothetical protein